MCAWMEALPRGVRVVEVGPRDGLQNENTIIPTGAKVAFIDQLSRSGLREIEVTSFVNPSRVPQMADAGEVLTSIEKRPCVRYSVLIPNVKGLARWLEHVSLLPPESRGISFFTAASETFNRNNIGTTITRSLQRFDEIIRELEATSGGEMPFVRAYVSMAFVSPYPGETIEPSAVDGICAQLIDRGAHEISLGDTIGAAAPRDVSVLLDHLLKRFRPAQLSMHFHDTRGTALANVLAAMGMGIATFDSSAGGLGGCPFAPGASGNLATEDLVYMLQRMGIDTGVDLSQVARASRVAEAAVGHGLPSKALQALGVRS